ncbi:MAG TPA: Gfo/Idh/MocA family oxidoreductase, partial [Candidatus Handelsmanbacteria bacterium]|nr:Gfo/Idh/MocA family oxidoreductase [Candidatus Handelsmanbacteria bacterium]
FYFASRDINKARRYSQEFSGAGVFGDYEEAIADPRIESLYFFTPHHIHLENVELAAKYGKHILVEKPMALTLGDCRRMIDACSQAGVKLAVGQTVRFWGAFLRTRQLIDAGVIGIPWVAEVDRMSAAARTPLEAVDTGRQRRPWRYDTRYAGGNILEGVVHELDFARAIFGEVTAATCVASGKIIDGDSRSPVLMQATLEFDHRRHATVRMGGLIGYDGGGTWISGTQGAHVHVRGPARDGLRQESCPELGAGDEAYDRELADLLGAITDDVEPENSGVNGMRNIGLGLALYRSIETGDRFLFEDGLPVGVDEDFQYRGPTGLI